ncbi:MAG: hypothetical protein JNJ54_01100 [Myxococcaceae bacterium]|nr:hypothetical protein [Myxococcaceae bacterium]
MRRLLSGVVVVVALVCTACPDPNPVPPTPPAPPRAFLTLPATTVVAPSVKGSVTTMGCKKVGQVQILESGNFIMDAKYSGEPTNFEILPALFNPLFPVRGFSTRLSLSAKVVCEDVNTLPDGGFTIREGLSQPLSLTFLPVESVRTLGGQQTLPDTFVAEGGVAGQPTTFIGCAGTNTGANALIRIDTTGRVVAQNTSLPFPCDYSSTITDRNSVSGTRWLWVPQAGAFSFDGDLNIRSTFTGEISRLSVSPIEGDALITLEDPSAATKAQVIRLRARQMMGQDSRVWSTLKGPLDTGFPGQFNADPVVDVGSRRVYTSSWQKALQSTTGLIAVLVYSYDTGDLVNAPPPAILTFSFPNVLNRPIVPNGAFKEDGTVYYAPLISIDNAGNVSTTTLACATNTSGCQGAARRWTGPTWRGELTTIVPFSRGNFVAVVGPFATYFIGTSDGLVKNLGGVEPLRPTGSLITVGVTPGKGTDFYLLNAPVPSGMNPTFPTEIIATDHPASGELWNLSIAGGGQPADSIFIAVDDNGQPWMRVGPDQVRPLGNMQYRDRRGATTPP